MRGRPEITSFENKIKPTDFPNTILGSQEYPIQIFIGLMNETALSDEESENISISSQIPDNIGSLKQKTISIDPKGKTIQENTHYVPECDVESDYF